MRLRRTGDATTTRRSGPKPSEARAMMRSILGDDAESPRTFSRHYAAQTILWDVARETGDSELSRRAVLAATRANGSFNVAEFERQALRSVFTALKAGFDL